MEHSIKSIFDKIIYLLKSKWWLILIVLFSFKGIRETWKDFKSYIVTSELKEKGINFKESNTTYTTGNNIIDTTIVVLENKIENTDYQKVKKQSFKHIKLDEIKQKYGIVIDTNDIHNDKIILSKWKSRTY